MNRTWHCIYEKPLEITFIVPLDKILFKIGVSNLAQKGLEDKTVIPLKVHNYGTDEIDSGSGEFAGKDHGSAYRGFYSSWLEPIPSSDHIYTRSQRNSSSETFILQKIAKEYFTQKK